MQHRESIRILFFSDWRIQPLEMAHRMIQSIGPVDAILYGGDDVARFGTESLNWFGRWAEQCEYGVGAILGNDCRPGHRKFFSANKVHNLHDVGIRIGNFGVIGIEGSLSHKIGRRQTVNDIGYIVHPDTIVEQHLSNHVKRLDFEPNCLVVVSHTPPAHVLDVGLRFGFNHLGSPVLRSFIDKYSPRLVLCGHCHSHGGRVETVGKTLVINAASDDVKPMLARMALIELANGKPAEVTWIDPNHHTVMSLPLIGPKKASLLGEKGIESPRDLFAVSDEQILDFNVGIGSKTITRLRNKQRAIESGRPVRVGRSDVTFDVPDSLVIYDVETGLGLLSPHEPWLIGAVGPDGQVFQHVVLDNDKKQRKQMYNEFMGFISQYPAAVLCTWSGTNFDARAMTAGMHRWNKSLTYKWSYRQQYDPLPMLRKSFELPFGMSWSLKSIAKWLGFTGYISDEQHMDGFQVGLIYEMYHRWNEPVPIEEIRRYNMLDLRALEYVVEWVRDLRTPDHSLYETYHPDVKVNQRKRSSKDEVKSIRNNRNHTLDAFRMEANRLGITQNRARKLGLNRLRTLTSHDEAIVALQELRVQEYMAITGKNPPWART